MSYRLSHIGEAAVEQTAPQPRSPAVTALQLMGVALVPWLPVLGGVWAGKKAAGSDGAWVGGVAGLTLSVVVMTSMLKKVGT